MAQDEWMLLLLVQCFLHWFLTRVSFSCSQINRIYKCTTRERERKARVQLLNGTSWPLFGALGLWPGQAIPASPNQRGGEDYYSAKSFVCSHHLYKSRSLPAGRRADVCQKQTSEYPNERTRILRLSQGDCIRQQRSVLRASEADVTGSSNENRLKLNRPRRVKSRLVWLAQSSSSFMKQFDGFGFKRAILKTILWVVGSNR